MCHTENPFVLSCARPLQRVEKLNFETLGVFQSRSQPLWFWAWVCFVAVGFAFGFRSLRSTQLEVPSIHPRPECSPRLSGNGQVLAFEVTRPDSEIQDLYVWDTRQGQGALWNRGPLGTLLDDSSLQPALDENGRWLVFSSFASNWVAEDRNGLSDVFCLDLQQGSVQRLVPPAPTAGISSSYSPSISLDGEWIAYLSYGVPDGDTVRGRNLCLYRRQTGEVTTFPGLPRRGRGPLLGAASISPSGRQVAFSAFVCDLLPLWRAPLYQIYLTRLDLSAPWPPSVPYLKQDHPLRDLWRVALLTHRADGGVSNANSYQPVLLEEECFFSSLASNLVAGDSNHCHDIFVRSLRGAGGIARLSLTHDGQQANDSSFEPCVSRDGRWLAYTSYASNLLPGDDNQSSDVFLLDRQSGRLECLSGFAPGPSHSPTLSSDGKVAAFVRQGEVYLWRRGQGLQKVEVVP